MRLHDLRPGSATLSLRAGVAMVAVQRRLGHSSIRVTSDIYTTVLAEVEREAAEATVAVVPRARQRVIPKPAADDEPAGKDGQKDDGDAGEAPDVPERDAA
ncbi:hypothetical protein ITX44_12215 [Streptomyces sp. KK5PA1]|uniref:Tyr recombinase domain-containing protein n=1 Tax=Actinacidiphila acididurans TaxID=2784346 RepID=A0ABS2TR46_9ACTN|nr:hypothetical protein [Actinacidiphila acididurans]